ncbi:hypothetical protein CRUP_019264, partial [Coryphaenoides rupestris]
MACVSWARLAIHTFMFSWFVSALWYHHYLTASGRDTRPRTYGGKWKYLTYLNMTFFYGLCVLTDLVHMCGRGAVRSFLFVFTMFWTLYTVDRELVYPKALDAIIPPWVLWVYHASGLWVYPILAKLSLIMFVLFALSGAAVLLLLYLLGEKISGRLWRHQCREEQDELSQ